MAHLRVIIPPADQSDQQKQSRIAAVMIALGDTTRLKVLTHIMAQGEMTGIDIAQALGMKQGATGNHMKVLELAGLVLSRRSTIYKFYRVNTEYVRQIVNEMMLRTHLPFELVGKREVCIQPANAGRIQPGNDAAASTLRVSQAERTATRYQRSGGLQGPE